MMNNVEVSRILQPEHCAYWQVKPVSIINIDYVALVVNIFLLKIYITTHGVQVVGLEKT